MSELVVEIAIVLIVGAIAALIAARRRSDPLFASYAKAHGMTLISSDRARMPAETPLLRKGESRYAERLLEGPLAGDAEGLLANYTYVEAAGSSEVRRRFTVAYLTVPESVPLVPELFLRPKAGPSALEGIEDALGGPRTRIELESADFDRRYEVFASEMQDLNRARQLFSPSFIVWLVEEAPPGFGFELVGGRLCCYREGHADDLETLDRIAAAATAVAKRLRDEAMENVSP
jgi:hypothetical protein